MRTVFLLFCTLAIFASCEETVDPVDFNQSPYIALSYANQYNVDMLLEGTKDGYDVDDIEVYYQEGDDFVLQGEDNPMYENGFYIGDHPMNGFTYVALYIDQSGGTESYTTTTLIKLNESTVDTLTAFFTNTGENLYCVNIEYNSELIWKWDDEDSHVVISK